MLHLAACSGADTQRIKVIAACRCAGVALANRYRLPPPVGLPRRVFCGSMAIPNGNWALSRTVARLPVVVTIMAVLPLMKSCGVEPQAMVPLGETAYFCARSVSQVNASTLAGVLKFTAVPLPLSNWPPLVAAMPWKFQ